jgi:DNA modification methylase
VTAPYLYYRDAAASLYCGDCRDVLPQLPAASIDLLLTDPPYGVGWESGRRQQAFAQLVGDDGQLPVRDLIGLTLRVLKDGRHLYVFGAPDLAGLPVTAPVELIWDKGLMGPGDLTLPWGPQHERILFGVHVAFATHRAGGMGRLAARLRRGSVIRSQRRHGTQVTRHPTEKPVDVLQQLIESSTVMGEAVLDPFAGSGSTLVAAKLEGRTAVGIEIEERYCEVAAKRLAQQVLPLEAAERFC